LTTVASGNDGAPVRTLVVVTRPIGPAILLKIDWEEIV